jgi:hypothetical protein
MWVYIVSKTDGFAEYEIDEVFDTQEKAINYIDKITENLSYDIDIIYSYTVSSHKLK